MIRKLLFLFVAACFLPAVAVAQQALPDFDWQTPEFRTVALDTFWLTEATPNANAALFAAQLLDWIQPEDIYYQKRNGNLGECDDARPFGTLLYSDGPFYYKAWLADGRTPGTVHCIVDTVGGNTIDTGNRNTLSWFGEYPCWTFVAGIPDSIRMVSAGTDTVKGFGVLKVCE